VIRVGEMACGTVHRHKTFTPLHLYISLRDALPYVRAAAKASLFARLYSSADLSYRVPEDR